MTSYVVQGFHEVLGTDWFFFTMITIDEFSKLQVVMFFNTVIDKK